MQIVPDDVAVNDIRQPPFERSTCLSRSFPLGKLLLVVDSSEAGISALAHGDGVQYRVQLTIPAGVESMPNNLPTRRSQRRSPCVTGEMVR